MRTSRLARSVPPVLAALLLAACSGSGGGSTGAASTSAAPGSASAGAPGNASGSTSTGSSSTGSSSTGSSAAGSSSATAASWGHQAGCPSVGRGVPAGAVTKPTVDVDGDGRPDTAFIVGPAAGSGAVTFGVRTASGGVFSAPFDSASPVTRSVLFADVTGHGEVIALADDGRAVQLFGVSACQLVPEKNPQGQQYTFDLGLRTGYGTGVGCVDANSDGTTDLVGLKYQAEQQGPGTITRTIVVLDGPHARNGASDTVVVSRADMAQEAQSVTCGDRTMTADGVTLGP